MKQSIWIILILGIALLLFACNEQPTTAPELSQSDNVTNTMAKKPMPKLVGDIYCDFTGTPPYFWVGEVEFPGDVVHGIRYESLGIPVLHGQSSHFKERFEIHTLGDPGDILIAGYDFGVLVYSNLDGRMRGVVDVANPPYEEWLGRRVNMGGDAIMGAGGPLAFDGWIRLH